MIRNFVAGLVWGGVVAGLGLAVMSQIAPLPGEQTANPPPVTVADSVAPESLPAVQPAPVAPAAVEPAPVVAAQTEAPVQGETVPTELVVALPTVSSGSDPTVLTAQQSTPIEPLPQTTPEPDAAPLAETAPQAQAELPPEVLAAAPEAADVAIAGTSTPAIVADLTPVEPPASPGLDVSPSASDAPPTVAELPEPLAPEVKEVLLQPAPETAADPAEMTPEPLPQIGPATAQDPTALPQVTPSPDGQPAPETAMVEPAVIAPDAALPSATTEGRLPQIGQVATPDADQATAIAEDLPRLKRYARNYSAEGDKPRFAVVLIDDGSDTLDRAKLAALPFAVTFAVDPLAANATEAEAIYRAAGQEVLILAKGIPEGATPSDLEQSLQALSAALPESIGVLDLDSGGFQDNRALATQVVSILKAQGRGILTYDRGLNAADQEARREDLPAAKVFRMIDAGNEEAPLIRRYLDRAAFKAAQEGQVVVVGHTRAETITALLEWTVEGRAASVSMAPASAVMQTK